MRAIYVYTLFDKHAGKPRCTGIRIGKEFLIKEHYRPGAGRILADVFRSIEEVRKIIITASNRGIPVVISDFKSHLKAFDIPLESEPFNVHDLHFPVFGPTDTLEGDTVVLSKVLDKMMKQTPREYQKILANAAVVYEDLERSGLMYNYTPVEPIYSQQTFSGRSKTTGFNIQGLADEVMIWPPQCQNNYYLLHFDWICADIRVASLLSRDERLVESFIDSDPYTYMMNKINEDADGELTREESKRFLLKSINSMDFGSIPLSVIYPKLGEWIRDCKRKLKSDDGYLETILGRKFRSSQAKNQLAALNGVMQGSVAHAMQLVIRRIWEQLSAKLVTEIHDSLVISCAPNTKHMSFIVNEVAKIMLHPFAGILEENPTFPVKVSVGKTWKKWKLLRTYR